jgi:hypothetical protein
MSKDVENGQVGILEVSLDGITVKFKNKKVSALKVHVCIQLTFAQLSWLYLLPCFFQWEGHYFENMCSMKY